MINKIRLAAILILFRIHPSVGAATLKEETKAAWEAYLKEANAAMQARLQPALRRPWGVMGVLPGVIPTLGGEVNWVVTPANTGDTV